MIIICDNLLTKTQFIWYFSQIPVISWFDDYNDTELLELVPVLETISNVEDVREQLKYLNHNSPYTTQCYLSNSDQT